MSDDIVEPGPAVTLRAGDAEAALYPAAGGRLGQIVANGRELLRGPEHAASGWAMWGAYALVPWSNRIPGGTFTFAGETITVPVNFDDGSAIHGLAAQAAWDRRRGRPLPPPNWRSSWSATATSSPAPSASR